MNSTRHFLYVCQLILFFNFLLSNAIFAHNNCESVEFFTVGIDKIQISGLTIGKPYFVYTYDTEALAYTTHCGNNCGSGIIISPNTEDDLVLVYYNGLFCKAAAIADLMPGSSTDCSVNFQNDACKNIDVYDLDNNRFLGTLKAMTHPFGSPPFLPGGKVEDSMLLPQDATRSYAVFNEGKNINNALPLATYAANCLDASSFSYSALCTDVAGAPTFQNTGCHPLSIVTSVSNQQTIIVPGESFRSQVNGTETYKVFLDGTVILEGEIFLGSSRIIEVDSGGEKDADGNCTDDTPPTPEPDCENIEIIKTGTGIKFTGLDGAPFTQAYIYNATTGAYEFTCYGNCSEIVEVDLIIENDQYLLGVIYYDADGQLLCYSLDSIN